MFESIKEFLVSVKDKIVELASHVYSLFKSNLKKFQESIVDTILIYSGALILGALAIAFLPTILLTWITILLFGSLAVGYTAELNENLVLRQSKKQCKKQNKTA